MVQVMSMKDPLRMVLHMDTEKQQVKGQMVQFIRLTKVTIIKVYNQDGVSKVMMLKSMQDNF